MNYYPATGSSGNVLAVALLVLNTFMVQQKKEKRLKVGRIIRSKVRKETQKNSINSTIPIKINDSKNSIPKIANI